ncbi:MAG TPA: hypothetical protein VGG89_08180 [Candidatus Baltobacteraceae bacterium]|jgi:hypothetical protein
MVYHDYSGPGNVCTGKLFWIWGIYAVVMLWLWNGLTAAGLPAFAIWALAGVAGTLVLLATREI